MSDKPKNIAKEMLTKMPVALGLLLLGGAVFAGLYWLVTRGL